MPVITDHTTHDNKSLTKNILIVTTKLEIVSAEKILTKPTKIWIVIFNKPISQVWQPRKQAH